MSRFVELTLHNTTQTVFVHADHIIQFWQPENQNYTVLELTNDKQITVREPTDDVWNGARA